MRSSRPLPLAPTAYPKSRFADLIDVRRMGLVDFVLDRRRIGDVFAFDFLGVRPVVLTRPEHLHHVLVDRAESYPKGDSVRNFRLIVGNGLFTADGADWKAHRALLQPYFRKSAVESYASAMGAAIEAQVARWDASTDRTIDVLDAMMELALDVVTRAMFGKSIADGALTLAHHYKNALVSIAHREHGAFPMWFPSPANLRLRWHKWNIDRTIRASMAERRRSGERRTDLLDALLHAGHERGEGLTDLEILDELATILIAGHETSAITMAWVFDQLARHPEVETRLLRELDAAGLDEVDVGARVMSLPYLRAVVDECLRLYPPVWINPRIASADDAIGGYAIPKGTMVLIGTYFTHRSSEIYEDPESFRPERFLANPTPDRFEFLPFGAGGRTCAGLAFAYQEILAAVATLVRRFRLRPTGQTPRLVAIGTLQPESMPMRIERRERSATAFRGATSGLVP